MTSLEQIVILNQEQEISETDPLTERSCQQFVRYFSRYTRDVLDVGCNTGRGGAIMKTLHRANCFCPAPSTAATLPRQSNDEWLGSAYDTPPIANPYL